MFKSVSEKNNSVTENEKQAALELHEMPLDNMDFEIVKKILSDHLAEDILPEAEVESSADDRFLELVVENVEEGLKKASGLLDVPIKELKYKVVEKLLKNVDGEIKEFQRIEFRLKLVSGKSQVKISEDKLSGYFSIVFPKTIDGIETDEESLLDLIKNEKITYGIVHDEIRKVVAKLQENYDAVTNIIIAKGKPPVEGEDSEIIYSLFSRQDEINYRETNGKYLAEILNAGSLETVRNEYFPVRYVWKNELLVSTSEPGDGENGIDVFGNEIKADKGSVFFQTGKNVIVKFEEGRINYYSETFGFLEYEDGRLNVHSPIWTSEDFMEAYYIGLPSVNGTKKNFREKEIFDQLKNININYGIIEEAIKEICNLHDTYKNNLTIKLISKGEKERKGEDARIELFFEEETQPGKILKDGRMDYREIDTVKTVKKNQLIAVKHFPKKGIAGKNMKGEIIPAPKGDDKALNALNNVKTVNQKGKVLYYSTIEGRVVLVGDSGISVNQQFEIKGNVDFSTGNIEFNGGVQIKGSVISGFKVKAEGDIKVNGMVNQGVELISNGNIVVKQGILGKNYNTRINAKGAVLAQYMQNAVIDSGADIVVNDYIMNSFVRAGGKVITPDKDRSSKGKGLIMGGEVIAMKGVIANTIGSDLAKNTKITAGVDYEFDMKIKNFNKGLEYCNHEITKLSKVLKLGFQDVDTLKKKIAKLPKEKQKPFIEAFKKLNEISQLRNEIVIKREKFSKETDELSRKAEILIKKELYPRVHIQIGNVKSNIQHFYEEKIRLKISQDRKYIEFLSS